MFDNVEIKLRDIFTGIMLICVLLATWFYAVNSCNNHYQKILWDNDQLYEFIERNNQYDIAYEGNTRIVKPKSFYTFKIIEADIGGFENETNER